MTDEEIRALLGNQASYDAGETVSLLTPRETTALANAALEARAERDKLQGELIGVLNRETASLVRWEDKLEASQAELAAARAELATVKAALNTIIGRDSHIDASIRSSGPGRVVEYGEFAKIARAALQSTLKKEQSYE